ncbi:MAG: Fis family transcriptional regulator [Flavobacterium sp.]|jgi:Fis family transcriptional regulator
MNDSIQLQERVNFGDESAKQAEIQNPTLSEAVERAINRHLDAMHGQQIDNLYDIVLSEIEVPLLDCVHKSTGKNQSLTAKILGLNRGTLRKKLKKYDML